MTRRSIARPRRHLLVGRAVQGRRQQDGALDVVVAPVLERELGAERPAEQPRARQSALAHEVHRGGEIERLGPAAVERALARAARRRRAARVEPQHGEIGEGGQPRGGLAEDVRVHEPARRGQRMQRHERRDGFAVRGQRELADQRQPVERLEFDVLPARGQQHRSADLHVMPIFQHLRVPMPACGEIGLHRRARRRRATPRGARRPTSIVRPHPGQV